MVKWPVNELELSESLVETLKTCVSHVANPGTRCVTVLPFHALHTYRLSSPPRYFIIGVDRAHRSYQNRGFEAFASKLLFFVIAFFIGPHSLCLGGATVQPSGYRNTSPVGSG